MSIEHSQFDDEAAARGAGEPPVRWIVWRQDDNRNRFEVVRKDSRAEAYEVAAATEARGHKQTYWIAKVIAPSS